MASFDLVVIVLHCRLFSGYPNCVIAGMILLATALSTSVMLSSSIRMNTLAIQHAWSSPR